MCVSVNDDTLDMSHSGRKKIEYCAGGLSEMDIRSAFRNVLEASCARACVKQQSLLVARCTYSFMLLLVIVLCCWVLTD